MAYPVRGGSAVSAATRTATLRDCFPDSSQTADRITDDWNGYATIERRGYLHTAIAERGDMQVAETFLSIIHRVFSNLKTWLRGIHHGVSPQHLQAYLNEFTFRFNRRFYPFNAFRSLLGIGGDVTAPTYAEFYAGT